MPEPRRRFEGFWPRHGIMASEAGRRVAGGVFRLTATSLAVAGVALAVFSFVAVQVGWLAGETLGHLAVGVLGGVIALAAAFVLLPAVGRLSGLGDDVRLLELCDPGAPLLRELMETAPGTYNHSIMTGAMAEAAAHEMGANALLARAGAYYHDIGKIDRPRFFAENQLGSHNPHDDASPEQSALVIIAHVQDGLERAKKARIPQPIIDIIEQHHGSSLVVYFYRKATACGLLVNEAPFRYEGRIPQSREAAIVMLADAAEAAGRALADCGPVQLESAVRRVIGSKRADGQLAASGLSDTDVELAVAVFSRMLSGQRHARTEYPDQSSEGARDASEGQF